MLKVDIQKARISIDGRFITEGSVLAGTIQATVPEINVRLEVESPSNPATVAKALRAAENGCYAIQSLRNPTPVNTTVTLNGAAFDLGAAT
jgi:hypothetical protein